MTPEQRALIVEFVACKLPEPEFVVRSGFRREAGSDLATQLLTESLASRVADDVECALYLIGAWDLLTPEHVPLLCEFIEAPWHTRHEDLASTLQSMRDPRSVDALFRAALIRRPDQWDDGDAVARKCTWALADIGTPAAKVRLQALADGSIESVASYARRRLDCWTKETARKGPR